MEEFFRRCLKLFVNGSEVQIDNPDPELSLLYYLRRKLRLTGTKQGCNEGGCGACTVMISKYDPTADKISHFSVNACLVSICSLDGVAVTTIEGIGSTRTKLHPCQERIARCHGSQCGFCTPGMVMSMYTMLRNNPQPTEEEMEAVLRGNFCRCTGYRPVLDSFRSFCSCRTISENSDEGFDEDIFGLIKFTKLDPSQEPIFPPSLKVQNAPFPLCLKGPRVTWYRPVSLEQLLILRDRFPLSGHQNRIVGGNNTIQVCQSSVENPQVLISVDSVPELKVLQLSKEGVVIGAGVTVAELCMKLTDISSTVPEGKGRVFACLLEMLSQFGSPQANNTMTLGGIVMSGSCSSDISPILVAAGSKLVFASSTCTREVTITSMSFSGEESLLLTNEVLVSISLPYSQENEFISAYKQSRRKFLDPAIVNCCMWVKMDVSIVRDCRMVFGNMGDHLITASQTMEAIVQREWDDDLFSTTCKILSEEMAVPISVEEGMAEYRLTLCLSFLYKFFVFVRSQILPGAVSSRELSVLTPLPCDPCKASKGFQVTASSQPVWDLIGLPLTNLSANEQATGTAKYVDDLPMIEGELFAGFVLSECAHGTFTVDTSALEGMKGIRAFISAKDVPGSNKTGLGGDENLFADGEVTAVGQIIGIVVAEDRQTAQRGAKSVKVTYEELPAIFTIEEAVSTGQFCQLEREIYSGDVHKALEEAELKLEGEVRVGGQEHFYMETCSCICIPRGEKGGMEIIASTQGLEGLQRNVCKALNVPRTKVTARVKAVGGSFGGKDERCSFPYTAVAVSANRLQSPVRAILERSEDILISGMGSPLKGVYEVGFTTTGQLTALYVDIYANVGRSEEVCLEVIEKAVLGLQSVYKIPTLRVNGRMCPTNLPSGGSLRGSGGPQALVIMETILSHVADHLGLNKEDVQELNLMKDGDLFVGLNEIASDCSIRRCWSSLLNESKFEEKKAAVEEFNRVNKWKKRGIYIVPTVHTVGSDGTNFGMGEASIQVYVDGTVLLSYGGVETGQGMDTRMVRVCAKALDIPVEKIHLMETSTDRVTWMSQSPDLNGKAIRNACNQILKRVQRFKEEDASGGWKNWQVARAYISRESLSVYGTYKSPNVQTDWNRGSFGSFYCYGAGCSVVEVDTLTGGFQVLSTDLVMDVGSRINPAIDIGQVESGFVQGLGLFTMEECVFLRDGKMHTVGPRTYKIPGCSDIPTELNITLLDKQNNSGTIFASSSLCEPPIFMAASVFFAIKEAVKSARAERGITGPFDFWSPATAERIRMACKDQFVEMATLNENVGQEKTWNIIP